MSEDKLTLEQLLERDKDKIGELSKLKSATEIDPEWLLLAEFGSYYGYQAIVDVRKNVISAEDMQQLLAGARRIENLNRYNRIIDQYTAFAATQTKGGVKALKGLLGELRKR